MRAEGDLLLPTAAEPEGDGWWTKVWRAGAVSVLIVSESSVWRTEMAALLEAEGYAVRQDPLGDAVFEPGCPYDIAVIDLAISGREVAGLVRDLRARTSIPILAMSPSPHDEQPVLQAYAAGVDQLVTRSMRPRELLARIRALLRRSPPERRTLVLDVDELGISLDLATGVAIAGGTKVWLTQRESEILCALLRRPGNVVTRDQLVGPLNSRQADRTLDSSVRGLRTKLEAAEGWRRVVAVRGVGFRLLLEAEPRPPSGVTVNAC